MSRSFCTATPFGLLRGRRDFSTSPPTHSPNLRSHPWSSGKLPALTGGNRSTSSLEGTSTRTPSTPGVALGRRQCSINTVGFPTLFLSKSLRGSRFIPVRSVLAGEVVDRPTLSASALSRVEKVLSLSPDRRRASVLNTKANQRLYGLLIKLPPPRESIVPPADLLSGKSPLSFFPSYWWVWSTRTQVNLLS